MVQPFLFYRVRGARLADFFSPISTIHSRRHSIGGVRWSNLDESLDNSSMAQCLVMLLVDTGLFAVLAWYLDKAPAEGPRKEKVTREKWGTPKRGGTNTLVFQGPAKTGSFLILLLVEKGKSAKINCFFRVLEDQGTPSGH